MAEILVGHALDRLISELNNQGAEWMSVSHGKYAVVLGAGMSGLLAARVLADFYDTVTVVERDMLPDDPASRRGVLQDTHVHVLLARCSLIVNDLFPGILDELAADGANVWSDGDLAKLHLSYGGHTLVSTGKLNPLPSYYVSRPFLEAHVRQRVLAIPNIAIRDGYDVGTVKLDKSRGQVTGASVVNRVTGDESSLEADLVIDATGRGSRMPTLLDSLGYGRPREDELVVRLAYTSQALRMPAERHTPELLLILPEPGRLTGAALLHCENDTWNLTLHTMMGEDPPSEHARRVEFIGQMVPTSVTEAVLAAQPIGDVSRYRVPSNRWRRYDKMERMPKGLLIIGDAVCSFNPIYGQGMTVAAIEAVVLRQCLQRGQRNLSSRFFRCSARQIGIAWQTAVGSDLALPEVAGTRTRSVRLTNAFLRRVLVAGETDPVIAGQFLRVMGMTDSPIRLLRPKLLVRVAAANLRRRRQGANVQRVQTDTIVTSSAITKPT
jgi:2-polyprenyl-6-methoxyphenol hydroxylase-like FAD-dependent oxidoreductase